MVPPVPMPQTKWVILPSRVFPNFRPGGLIVRVGIHGIVVLVGVKGVGNFARQFFGHGVVAAGIFRFDRGGADNHLGAKAFSKSTFSLDCLSVMVKTICSRVTAATSAKSHAGVAGGPFDDGAAGLEQAFSFGFVDHGDAYAVLHRAAGIDVSRL